MNAKKVVLLVLLCAGGFSAVFLIAMAWLADPIMGAIMTMIVSLMGAGFVAQEWPD